MSWNISQTHQRRGLATGAAAVLALGTLTATAATAAPTSGAADHQAPLIGAERASAVDGSYIVVLEDGATRADTTDSVREAKSEGASDIDRYSQALTGFSAELSDSAVAELRSDPDVAYIEADQRVSVAATQSPATWGLDRIDQRNLPLNNAYTYNSTGQGVRAYVIDTGVRATHSEFGGRVAAGATAIDDGRGANDCNGHGTHVAGTIGGATYGVAKQVTIVPVRVLDCNGSGSTSGVIAGVDWVTSNAAGQSAVANMSLGGGASTALDNAVSNSIASGVTYAVAAGNESANACNGSPSRVGAALTVGLDDQHRRPLELLQLRLVRRPVRARAPASPRRGTRATPPPTPSRAPRWRLPHVAGVAALYLQGHPGASPSSVGSAIVGGSTSGVVGNPGSGSPNRLLYSQL